MATELVIIRHGETRWNSEQRMQGQMNTELSPLGRAQARALGRRMANEKFDHLYSSDLSRARETALAIAANTGHTVVTDERLRERSFGIFEGLNRAEMQSLYPGEYARFRARDPDYAIPGGESPRAFHERAMRCFHDIAERHDGGRVVIVAHGLLLVALYRTAHGLDLSEPHTRLELVNAGLNVFQHAEERWRMLEWADRAHLHALTEHSEGEC
jgi:probable phosphoglycerate mutase